MAGNNEKMGLARWKRQRRGGICPNFAADVDEIMGQLSLPEGGIVAFLEPWVPPASGSALTLRPNFDTSEFQSRRRSLRGDLSASGRVPPPPPPHHHSRPLQIPSVRAFRPVELRDLFLIRTSRELLVTH